MNNYYVLKVLNDKGIYRPDSIVIDGVEVRSPKDDYADETKVIKESNEFNKLKLDIDFNSRLGIIIIAESENEAEIIADQKFVKVLDILSSELPMSNVSLSKCGYTKNLETGEIKPLKSFILSQGGTSFIRATSKFHQFEFSQWVATENTELSKRYIRSLHWSRNAKWENNAQLRIIFRWFAVEALFKKGENDRVDPIIRWFLGYPNGSNAQYISLTTKSLLLSNPIYDRWKKKITSSIDEIRVFRNNSIHNGFTNTDLPKSKLNTYDQIMMFASSRCQNAVMEALRAGIQSVEEFREYIPIIFESNQSLVTDVHNTILYSLENDPFSSYRDNVYT